MVDCLSELMIILNRTYKEGNGKRPLIPSIKLQWNSWLWQQITVFKRVVKQIPEVEAAKIGEISKRISKAKQTVYEATAHLDRQVWQETKTSAQQGRIAAEATRKTAHDIRARVIDLQQETSEGHDKLSSQVDLFRSQMIDAADQMGDQLAQTKRQITKEGEERKQFEAGLQRLVDALPATIHEQLQSALYQFIADSIVQRRKLSYYFRETNETGWLDAA